MASDPDIIPPSNEAAQKMPGAAEPHDRQSSEPHDRQSSEPHDRQSSEPHDRQSSEPRVGDDLTRLKDMLSASGIATWNWDLVNDRVQANSLLADLFSVSPEDAAGGRLDVYLQAIHPDDRPRAEAAIGDALAHGEYYEVEYRVVQPEGSFRWLVARGRVERDSEGSPLALTGVVFDITEHAERGRRERFLAELAERARGLTDPDDVIQEALRSLGQFLGLSRCTFADVDIDADLCAIRAEYCADTSVPSIVGKFPLSSYSAFVIAEFAAGRAVVVDDVRADPLRVPAENVAAYEAIGVLAHVTVPVLYSARLVSCVGAHSATPRHWKPEEVDLFQTVVERTWLTVEVLRQNHALAREAEDRREAHERTTDILDSIADAFFALDDNFRFTYVNAQAERVLFRTRAQLLGQKIWDAFPEGRGSTFDLQYRRALAERISVSFEEFYAPLSVWFEVRAFPSPEGLSVFFQNVNARKAAQDERERLLAVERARAAREALLNRIGQTLRGSPDPEAILRTAVRLLGESLEADRCYFAVYDLGRGVVNIAHDWCRADLTPISGVYPFSNTAQMFNELYRDSHTSVIEDAYTAALSVQTLANMESLGLRSRVSVALVDGEGLMATLTAATAGGPRAWSDEEVALIEAVATQVRTAVEMARVVLREHNIASQLQTALQPELPGKVPGLALAKHYEAALAEAGVGGDFYDVFAIEKGCTALVVGDLSGKGLAAASQVSTVRNMLRAFLYSLPTIADAVTELNRVLAENGLLTGFATLFVGTYDGGAQTLKYINCGQEPALVRRAQTGEIERLEPAGPILGAIEGVRYAESSIALASGDALAIFTDGLTEVGASRKAMLGVEGVAALLAEPIECDGSQSAEQAADEIVARLITGVESYAQTSARDDMCLLVGVAQ